MKTLATKSIFVGMCLAFLVTLAIASTDERLVSLTFTSEALRGNLLGTSHERQLLIYLPPSYQTTPQKAYPVIYFLNGYGTPVDRLADDLVENLDATLIRLHLPECIFVMVDGCNLFGGSFYVNSSVTGRWADYVAKDLVTYIDSHFRTLQQRTSRAISGFSMGGFGSLHIAMHYPDQFCAVYAISPGLLSPEDEMRFMIFPDENTILDTIDRYASFASMTPEKTAEVIQALDRRLSAPDGLFLFSLAYGTAFSPNPGKPFPHIDYPFVKKPEEGLVEQPETMMRYAQGFGRILDKVEAHPSALKSLCITVEVGAQDRFEWLYRGTRAFSDQLSEHKIAHTYIVFDGTHNSHFKERLYQHAVPHLLRNLQTALE